MTRHDALPEPPRWLWLWLPVLLFSALLSLGLRDDTDLLYTRRWWATYLLHDEERGIELATPVAAALGAIAGGCALRHWARLPTGWIRWWVLFVTLASAFLAGEEAAWGQNQLGFASPEWWPIGVTNVHSLAESDINRWWAPFIVYGSEEVPRLLLELFALGGIIRVFWLRGDVKKGDWRDWFWPTHACLPTALIAILVRMPERLDWLGFGYAPLVFDPNLLYWAGLQETCLAAFLFMYLLSIWYRAADGTDCAPTRIGGSKQLEPSP